MILDAPEAASELIDLIPASWMGEASWQRFPDKLNEIPPAWLRTPFIPWVGLRKPRNLECVGQSRSTVD